eukprot:scaffold29891_cov47-Phaeocystis_antarctica.AAC.2
MRFAGATAARSSNPSPSPSPKPKPNPNPSPSPGSARRRRRRRTGATAAPQAPWEASGWRPSGRRPPFSQGCSEGSVRCAVRGAVRQKATLSSSTGEPACGTWYLTGVLACEAASTATSMTIQAGGQARVSPARA